MRGAVDTEIDRLYKSGLSKNDIGPAVAGVFDIKTGKYYFGINDRKGKVPKVCHPLIKKRIDDMPIETYKSYEKWTLGEGSHAEVYALNMPRCPHCEYITDGASYFPEVLKYGK